MFSAAATASLPPPEAGLPPLPEIVLRVDLRNLSTASDEVPQERLLAALEDANRVWGQCSIRFKARLVLNVSATRLNVPCPPRSQSDLSLIAGALNPRGPQGAIPLTVAGHWKFFDAGSGLYLHGLGWVIWDGGTSGAPGEVRLDRIGAMISRHKLGDPRQGALIGHELGHALSLGHSAVPDNVMAGGDRLTAEQCAQARRFSRTVLAELREETLVPVTRQQAGQAAPARPAARKGL